MVNSLFRNAINIRRAYHYCFIMDNDIDHDIEIHEDFPCRGDSFNTLPVMGIVRNFLKLFYFQIKLIQ